VTFFVLARPIILKLAGAVGRPPAVFPVRAGFSYRKKPGRREYLRASLKREEGAVVAHKYPHEGAGILSSIVRCDGLVVLDEAASAVNPGMALDFLPFSEVLA
jgi:molybdopterin molybdotransferase